jgi:alkylation response protein AidB-like acyl-CoA dehydrogenase
MREFIVLSARMTTTGSASPHPIVAAVRRFVQTEVSPVATALEHADTYPHALVARMRELGLFGALIPLNYGGLGLAVTDYARVIEELCRGWMSLAGVINSHTMMTLIVLDHGTEEQRRRFLPRFARGEARGGLCLTEPHAGTDVQAIRTVARRRGDEYVVNGTKMFITNGREGNTFALLALTDPGTTPAHRGMSCFIVEKGHPGLRVVKSIAKLGYKGVDTAELLFEDFVVPADNLVGGVEGRGFKHVMSGLETGRINIAARAVGVAQAAFDATRARRERGATAPARLADMATRLTAARLLTYWAADMKDRNERCDLEAGMAKLYATEAAQQNAADALSVHGAAGLRTSLDVERHYRDTPLMIIGEGTNEIQRVVIARNLLERYGERVGALTSREDATDEQKQIVLAVRQVVDKEIVPVAAEQERADCYPAGMIGMLAELGILGAVVPTEYGGLALDPRTTVMIIEELARGWTTVAAILTAHSAAAVALSAFGPRGSRERLLPAMTRGEVLGTVAFGDGLDARREDGGWFLSGAVASVDLGARADVLLLPARLADGDVGAFLVGRGTSGIVVTPPSGTLGARGLDVADLQLDGVRVDDAAALTGRRAAIDAAMRIARLGAAATAVGLAQAAFEAALRYSQQRTTFGKPICQHQAIQLKLADMATAIATARLMTYHAATADSDDLIAMAKVHASERAAEVTLESMRIHGGYGYTAEFPVERYYRDAPRLLATPTTNDAERTSLAARLAAAPVTA